MNAYTAVALINVVLVLTVCAISLAGLFIFGSFGGLWSILMLFFMMSTETKKGEDDE